MIIPINDKYRINSDSHSWIVQKRQDYMKKDKETGERVKTEGWLNVGYYGNLESAIKNLFDYKLRVSDTEGLQEAINEAKSFAKELNDALSIKDINVS